MVFTYIWIMKETKYVPSTVINHLGETCVEICPEEGYYRIGKQVYHVTGTGITHVNLDLINRLEHIFLCGSEKLDTISKDEFDSEMRNAILTIGIYKYLEPEK